MSYELYVWVVEEPDGKEGAIAAYIPGAEQLGPMVLQSRNREGADAMMSIARQHGEAAKMPVRLIHLKEVERWL